MPAFCGNYMIRSEFGFLSSDLWHFMPFIRSEKQLLLISCVIKSVCATKRLGELL